MTALNPRWRTLLLPLILFAFLAACTVDESTPLPTAIPARQATPAVSATTPPSPTSLPPTATLPSPTPTASATPSPSPTATATSTPTPDRLRFAVIGDYGLAGEPAAAVATLVAGWQPDLILTTGDNNYPDGEPATIDDNIGQYYADYIYPYTGSYPRETGDEHNRFFPTLGNHDVLTDGGEHYLEYFTLPGNERYYDFVWGPVHFFALNSNWNEPDAIGVTSVQAQWLQEQLAASTSPWRVVYFHVAPYSSGVHGSATVMQWPFREWGASVVLAGHNHVYERLVVDDLPYFIVGASGYPALYAFVDILPESQFRYNQDYGALRVGATPREMQVEFVTRDGAVIDRITLVNQD
ncbi:MAG: metallophosphoesterase [Anaerolineae bacterium]|nr:metallophosphoesterase [Anaerolineae bacterium]